MASNPAATGTAPPPASTDWMRSIAGQIEHLSSGDHAALRRMQLTRSSAADAIVVRLLLGAKIPEQRYERDWDRWRLIGHFTALLSGTAKLFAHDEHQRLGGALFDAGVSEKRLLRLLASRGDALRDQLALAVRIVARKRMGVNLWAIYHLLGDDPAEADDARLHIAQQYFAAQAKSN